VAGGNPVFLLLNITADVTEAAIELPVNLKEAKSGY
jgi:hypothetical protein